jgi:hypothetical protein
MVWTLLQITGLIVLGWIVLAVLVAAGMSLFLRGAHRLERQVPTDPDAIRDWVRGNKVSRAA